MKRGRVLLAWSEPAAFHRYLRREVRKHDPWVVVRNAGFLALLVFGACVPGWLDADPEKRLPFWALPLPALAAGIVLVLIFVVLPQRFSRNGARIREKGIEFGPVSGGKGWYPFSLLACYEISEETAETGETFTFLECFPSDGGESVSIVVPSGMGHDGIRILLESLGLKEGLPE